MPGRPDPDLEVVLDAHAVLGEGPVWVGDRLWWVDIEGHRIHRTDPSSRGDEILELGEPVGAVVPRRGGGFVAGMRDGVAVFSGADTEERRILVEADVPESRMNDAKCDPAGRLFTGTYIPGEQRSALYRVDPDGSVTTVFTGVGTSNGLGWSPEGDRMYYIDTATGRVDVCDYDAATGAVEGRRPLVEIDPADGRPDGMCVDAEGCLWVAFWEGWCLRRYDPDGELLRTVEVPVARVTSCAFGGADLDQLFITTASTGLTGAEVADQPLAGALFRIEPGTRGRPTDEFAG